MARTGPKPELPKVRAYAIEQVRLGKTHREMAAELRLPSDKIKRWCKGIVRQTPEAVKRTKMSAGNACGCGNAIKSRRKFCDECREEGSVKTAWGRCRYCGGSNDIIERRSGEPGSVCRPCRNARNARDRTRPATPAAPRPPRRRYAGPRLTVEERGRRIQAALAVANAQGITLVQALAIEGVI